MVERPLHPGPRHLGRVAPYFCTLQKRGMLRQKTLDKCARQARVRAHARATWHTGSRDASSVSPLPGPALPTGSPPSSQLPCPQVVPRDSSPAKGTAHIVWVCNRPGRLKRHQRLRGARHAATLRPAARIPCELHPPGRGQPPSAAHRPTLPNPFPCPSRPAARALPPAPLHPHPGISLLSLQYTAACSTAPSPWQPPCPPPPLMAAQGRPQVGGP